MTDWRYGQTWIAEGDGFYVRVAAHFDPEAARPYVWWSVAAYLDPRHPLWAHLEAEDCDAPGPILSTIKFLGDRTADCCVVHDENNELEVSFTYPAPFVERHTREEVPEVFADAEALFAVISLHTLHEAP